MALMPLLYVLYAVRSISIQLVRGDPLLVQAHSHWCIGRPEKLNRELNLSCRLTSDVTFFDTMMAVAIAQVYSQCRPKGPSEHELDCDDGENVPTSLRRLACVDCTGAWLDLRI